MARLVTAWMLGGLFALASTAGAQTPPPVPKPAPFPGSTTRPATTQPPAAPAADTAQEVPLDPALAGIPVYPNAELLAVYDGGRGQRIFLLGTNMAYADIVAYYKTQFRSSGNEVFKTPAMHQFDLGSFRSDSMSFRPSVVVKDYTWMDSPGYLHVTGTTEKRFRTIIQIVPPPQ